LFTVPVRVMRLLSSIAPPKRVMGELSKAFPFKTGLDVFISAIFISPLSQQRESLARVLHETGVPTLSLDRVGEVLQRILLTALGVRALSCQWRDKSP
jgi:hypothetical protein